VTRARCRTVPAVRRHALRRRALLNAGEGGPSIGPTELSPASHLCVSRAEVSAAGGRVGIRAAGARSVEGMEPRDGGAGREVAARRGTK
jgi:hypothetical protein